MTASNPATTGTPTVEWPRHATIFLCALAAALPLVWRGNSCGHDFDFHIQSWLAVAQQWRQGTLYPHWIEAANYGAGEPRFVFYPPLSWMLGAILGTIFPWAAAPIAFTLIVLAACGLSMDRLAREWLPPNAATVAACAYVLNPYALFVAYERTAYAELAAGIWLPLILLYALRPASTNAGAPGPAGALWLRLTWVPHNRSTLPLALAIAAIWLTNAPAAVMASYALAAITIWKSIKEKTWRPILNSAIGLTLGLGLASFYILPAAYQRRWVDIARAIGPGMRIEDSFLFARTGESFHDQVLRTASWIFVTMVVTILVSACVIWRNKAAPRFLLPLSVTAAVLFALQLRWSGPIWRLAPELRFLQFPWRWTLMLGIAFALSLGAAVTRRLPEANLRIHAGAVLIAAIAAVSLGLHFFWQPCDEEDAVSAQLALFKAGTGFQGTDEYTPLGADNSIVQQSLPKLRLLDAADAEIAVPASNQDDGNPTYTPSDRDHLPLQAKIEQWLPQRKILTFTSPSPGFAVLRLMDYPAWRVLANGNPVLDRPRRDDGLMAVPVPAGATRLDIEYLATPDLWWGRGISAASLLTLLTLALVGEKRRAVV